MFKKLKHLGHSARWVTSMDGGWEQICSCGKVLVHRPGNKELSKLQRR